MDQLLVDRKIHHDEARDLRVIVETLYDTDCSEPFDGDEGIHIVILHRRYSDPAKGECGRDGDEVRQWAEDNAADWFVAPLFMFEHGNVALSTGDFGDRWDSGQVGIVALKRSEWGAGAEPDEKLAKWARNVAVEYGQWMDGQCYGYRILVAGPPDGGEDDSCEELDSTWGFVGSEAVEDAIKEALPDCFDQVAERRDAARAREAEALEATRPDMYGEAR